MESYPTVIFPQNSYITKLNIDKLLSRHKDLMIVRQVEGKKDDYMLQSGNITIISTKVFKNNMANLSFNLAGGMFDVSSNSHLRFLPVGAAAEPWGGGSIKRDVSFRCDSYKIIEPCFGLCFRVADIHKKTFPFYRHFENERDWSAYREEARVSINKKERDGDEELVGAFDITTHSALTKSRLEVNHAPNMSNYWHITLDTYPPNTNQPILPNDRLKNQDKKMFESLKHHLVKICKINVGPSYELSIRDYTKCYFLFWKTIQNKVEVLIKSMLALRT